METLKKNEKCYYNIQLIRKSEVRILIVPTGCGHPTTLRREVTYEKAIYPLFYNHDFAAMFSNGRRVGNRKNKNRQG
jgi:hypothetical protein